MRLLPYSFDPSHLVPALKAGLQSGTVLLSPHAMPSRLEVIGDGAKRREKALSMSCRFEFPHFPLDYSAVCADDVRRWQESLSSLPHN